MKNDESPEGLVAALFDMRAMLEPLTARTEARALLAARGYPFDEELWETFFDPEKTAAAALYDAARALWVVDWPEGDHVAQHAALLLFEAAKNAGCVYAAFALADALDWLGDERAEQELREFVTMHPAWEDPRLYGVLGGLVADFYNDEGHLEEALAFLEHVDGADELWIRWRALAIAKLGRHDEAIALLQDQLAAEDRDALRILGDIHEVSGDKESAKRAYLRSVAAGDEIAARRLAIMFTEHGDERAATQAFAVAAERGDAYSAERLREAGLILTTDGHLEELSEGPREP